MDWISTQLDEVGGMQAPAVGVNKGTEAGSCMSCAGKSPLSCLMSSWCLKNFKKFNQWRSLNWVWRGRKACGRWVVELMATVTSSQWLFAIIVSGPVVRWFVGGRLFKPHNSLRKIGTVIFISTLQTKKLRLRDVRQRVEGHGWAEPNVRRNQGWEGSIIGEWIGPGERLVSCCGYSFLCLRGTWHVSSSITSTSVVSAGWIHE